jgi:hypothetical protein
VVTTATRPDAGTGGKARFGCLFTLLVIGAAVYLGLPFGKAYFDYWSLRDEMRTQVRLAAGVDDATILRRLQDRIRALGLPEPAARNLRVRRQARQIVVSTSYEITFNLQFTQYTHRFNPQARQPL